MLKVLKWLGTFTLIVGSFVNSAFPEVYPIGPTILILGGLIWFSASIVMRDAPLMVTNFVMTMAGLSGIILNNFI